MYLKYVEIQGFKSFPDKTKIEFRRGMTAVVGPNGSGKSNISDAIRWVLGEQSSKSLRSGKMEDIVFGGTKLRRPMGFAQVSLGLDNSDGRLGDLGSEVVVTRRYYRSGDGEYLINGNQVRLRDVRETFLDTGLSRDGYSVIEQGRIAEIVAAKPLDRREIFEEASGIAKYRFRKNEAEKRLAAAQENLERLRDILGELESRVGPLKEQSETAARFLVLSQEKRSLEITLYCDTIERTRRSVREQEEQIELARSSYDDAEQQLAAIEREQEEQIERSNALLVAADRRNADSETIQARIAGIESANAVVENDILHAQEQIAALEEERSTSQETRGGITARIREAEERRVALEAQLASAAEQIEATERLLQGLANDTEQTGQRREETARRLAELTALATDLQMEEVSAKTASEALEERMDGLSKRIPELKKRDEESSAECAELQKALQETDDAISSAENQKSGYAQKRKLRADRLQTEQQKLEEKQVCAQQLSHRIAALIEMERSMEGFAPSVRKVIEASKQRELRGIVGTFASLISIRSGCETAIEIALGAAIQNIVVKSERDAKDAIAFLKERRAGRATFLPLDTLRPNPMNPSELAGMPGVVGVASELVRCDPAYDAAAKFLLGRVAVAEDITAASALARALRYRYRVVTLDGQVVNVGGSFTGGWTAESVGVFSRKNEISRLEGQRKTLIEEADAQKKTVDALSQEVVELDAQITVLNSEQINLGGDRIRIETELRRAEAEAESFKNAAQDAAAQLESAQEQRALLAERIRSAEAQLEKVRAETADLERYSTDEDASMEDFHRRRIELGERLSEQKLGQMELQKDLEASIRLKEEMQAQALSSEGRSAEIDRAIAALSAGIESRRSEIAVRTNEIDELRAMIEANRAAASRDLAERAELERTGVELRGKNSEIARSREELAKEITRLEERRAAAQKEFDGAVSRLWEDYELTFAEADSFKVDFTSITALRQQVAKLRGEIKGLGTVNLSAIEEYKEVGERYRFMTEQVGDVEHSKEELEEIIAGLMTRMQSIFLSKFSDINRSFGRVFADMFGGGTARLSLTDENDVLGSGIEIDVQPPGKVIRSLSLLSGGEQSLVAIAIYFAILSVNPAPFCVLDEIDSALDDANVSRFARYLAGISDETQFVAITHRRGTMEAADELYGVTMQEEGVSRLLKLTKDEAVVVVAKQGG